MADQSLSKTSTSLGAVHFAHLPGAVIELTEEAALALADAIRTALASAPPGLASGSR